LPGIEFVGPGAAGMTMYFHLGAAPFSGQSGGHFFQVAADAQTSGAIVDGKIADPGEVAPERDLRYKMQREKAQDDAAGVGCGSAQTSRVSAGSRSIPARRTCKKSSVPGYSNWVSRRLMPCQSSSAALRMLIS
jgi:hypothetical protein